MKLEFDIFFFKNFFFVYYFYFLFLKTNTTIFLLLEMMGFVKKGNKTEMTQKIKTLFFKNKNTQKRELERSFFVVLEKKKGIFFCFCC